MKESIYDYIEPIKSGTGVVSGYQVMKDKNYFSKRYQKYLKIKASDRCFSDGTLCTNWQASKILSDILKSEGRWFRSRSWFAATWLFGGGKARNNGMF